jgi:hypothetical protein
MFILISIVSFFIEIKAWFFEKNDNKYYRFKINYIIFLKIIFIIKSKMSNSCIS